MGSSGKNGNDCFENPCDKITCRPISIFHNVETRTEKSLLHLLSLHFSDTRDPVVWREAAEAGVAGQTAKDQGS